MDYGPHGSATLSIGNPEERILLKLPRLVSRRRDRRKAATLRVPASRHPDLPYSCIAVLLTHWPPHEKKNSLLVF